jgi:predicted ATPase
MVQLALGAPLQATKGYAAPEVGAVYGQAYALCQQMKDTPQLFQVLQGLWVFYLLRGELLRAHELGEQLLRLAHSVQDPSLLLEAHVILGNTLLWLGEFASAQAHLEQGTALYDPQQHHSHVFVYGHDPGMWCLSFLAWTLWYLGYPDQARKKMDEALAIAHELAHPFSLAFALLFAADVHQLCRERQAVQNRVEALMTLSSEQGFPFWLARGTIPRGWVLVDQGQEEEGTAYMRQGLAAYQATGAGLNQPYYLALLAEAYGKMGQTTEGLTVLAEVQAIVENTRERHYQAELYRLRGQLTLQKFQVSSSKFQVPPSTQYPIPSTHAEAEAEACFLKAIEIARHQQAKSLELRAVMSLSRLWQSQGKQQEAHELLAEIYGWFTEGFDTKDLQEAQALLTELQ